MFNTFKRRQGRGEKLDLSINKLHVSLKSLYSTSYQTSRSHIAKKPQKSNAYCIQPLPYQTHLANVPIYIVTFQLDLAQKLTVHYQGGRGSWPLLLKAQKRLFAIGVFNYIFITVSLSRGLCVKFIKRGIFQYWKKSLRFPCIILSRDVIVISNVKLI